MSNEFLLRSVFRHYQQETKSTTSTASIVYDKTAAYINDNTKRVNSNKLATYGTGGRLLRTANFKVTWRTN